MVTVESIDIRGFNRFVESIQNALIGTGQNGDLMKVAKSEVRQLSAEISAQVGPRTSARGEKSIENDMRESFRPGPVRAFEASKRGGAGGDYGVSWLYASPTVLVGVRFEDMKMQSSVTELRHAMRVDQTKARGVAWKKVGRRGAQAIMILNRAVIGRERYAQLKRVLWNRVGRLRASFALAAKELGMNKTPAFVSRHFAAVKSDGTGIFRYSMSGAAVTAIEFGSRAPGVLSNPHIQKKIHNAIERRKYFAAEKVKRILSGYKYNWETGAVFKSNTGEQMLKQLEANEELYNSL